VSTKLVAIHVGKFNVPDESSIHYSTYVVLVNGLPIKLLLKLGQNYLNKKHYLKL